MFNIFKRKEKQPITIHCYTYDPTTYAVAPIQKANRFFPKFIKDLEKSGASYDLELHPKTTMKGCTGFLDLFKKGFIIPTWSETLLRVGPKGDLDHFWRTASTTGDIQVHSQYQRGAYADEKDYQHFKLCPPWIIQASESVDILWSPPMWNYNNPDLFLTLTGVINYTNHVEANVNIVVPKREEQQIIKFNENEPLAHLIPLTERPIEVVCHLVSKEEYYQRLESNLFSAKLTNKTDTKPINKCPFHRSAK